MYPHERSLVEKYRHRPFALLGVNSDEDRDEVKAAVERHQINWRSWFAGGPDGAIPRQWNVTSWPTILLIDANGIVRHRLTSFHGIEPIVEALLAETGG